MGPHLYKSTHATLFLPWHFRMLEWDTQRCNRGEWIVEPPTGPSEPKVQNCVRILSLSEDKESQRGGSKVKNENWKIFNSVSEQHYLITITCLKNSHTIICEQEFEKNKINVFTRAFNYRTEHTSKQLNKRPNAAKHRRKGSLMQSPPNPCPAFTTCQDTLGQQ